jgi:hypothetical protein
MTKYPELFEALSAPFPQGELKTLNKGGRSLTYIQAHTVMERLDAVLGPENWWTELIPTGTAHGTSWLCKLTIRLPDGSLLTKQDVGSNAGMTVNGQPDTENDDKSGASDAIKRAAVHFGIARYLRGGMGSGGPMPRGHGDPHGPGPASASTRNGSQSGSGGGGNSNQPPRTGKALFAWIKQAEQRHGSGLLTYINEWASAQGYAGRMVEWSPTVVSEAYLEAVAAIQRSLDE